MKLASIIILNYNGKKFMKDCLSSVYKQTYRKFEVIVVDNSPGDGSANFIRKNFRKVKIIQPKKNLGFAEGNNFGVKNSKGEYIVLLNQDTAVDKNWLKELITILENKNVVACQSKVLFFNQKNKINVTGIDTNFLGFGWCGNFGIIDKGQFKDNEITFPSGVSVIFKKNVFIDVKGFDKDYFTYQEDSDLGWRIRLKGYKTILASKSLVYHKYSFSRNIGKFYYLERNRIITLLKNYSVKTLLLILPAFLLTEIGVIFYSLKNGWFNLKLKGYWWILKNIKKIYKKRRFIQKTRKINDKEIIKYFTDEIKFKEVEGSPLLDSILNPILSIYWRVIKSFI